jgi:hypothetical protein
MMLTAQAQEGVLHVAAGVFMPVGHGREDSCGFQALYLVPEPIVRSVGRSIDVDP